MKTKTNKNAFKIIWNFRNRREESFITRVRKFTRILFLLSRESIINQRLKIKTKMKIFLPVDLLQKRVSMKHANDFFIV